ncbi:SubName: Full=Uncharacterized protein {ECO:0000313/EMBL:CCA68600.1} [Serendipita indica DSM 11827]|nr:SubName: Full=Uncharacterized protein {ECO:0000313/EMBL:CCA68600.1} [Serendipita indica DSM 11827]
MEVTITPSSSVYFAGEQLKVTITFTNLTAPSAVTKPHRRGHSISSAPLARPPTSPGVFTHKYAPSSPAIAPTTGPLNAPRRRGLVGHTAPLDSPSTTRSKQTMTFKSTSTTISKSEIAHLALENASAASAKNRKALSEKPFPANHPHARKVSVQWHSVEQGPPTAMPSPHPLSLDPISEINSPTSPSTPAMPSPAIAADSLSAYPTETARSIPKGLGIDFPSSTRIPDKSGPRSASAGTLPIQGAETLLWAYAQVIGNVEFDPSIINNTVITSIKSRLARGGPIGGGRMDLHDKSPSSNQPSPNSWSSLFGFSSPRTPASTQTSFLSGLLSSRPTPGRLGQTVTDDPNTLPTFTPPQSMLAVDLTLAPGESRTSKSKPAASAAVKALSEFGRELLESNHTRRGSDGDDYEAKDTEVDEGCRFAVEVLTRQSRKGAFSVRRDPRSVLTSTMSAAYDVHRGGVPVASLVMPKTVFRLGETVHGVVAFNLGGNELKVVKVNYLLETSERTLQSLTGTKMALIRRVQGEQHEDMVLNLQQTFFALDIPSDASPGFGLRLGAEMDGGLEWRVRICFLVGDGSGQMDDVGVEGEWAGSFSAGDGAALGKLETVECEIPIVVLPAHTVFGSIPVSFSV